MHHVTSRLALALLLGAGAAAVTGCTTRGGIREDDAAECSNGVDDDEDGQTDCAEPACAVHVSCGGPGGDGSGADGGVGSDSGTGGTDADLGDAPPMMCVDPIDVVFVLDVSTSMAEDAGRLRDGIGAIFTAADALTPDHTFGLVVFVDDALVVSGCSSFPTASNLQDEFDEWRTFCATNGNPGGSPGENADCPENSLDAIYAAATMCPWRAGATHILIHVTDDTFEEPPYVYSDPFFGSGGVPAERRYAEVVDALVSRQIHVGAFALEVAEECGAGRSPDTARGFFTPFDGMASLPEATMGAAWDLADVRRGTVRMEDLINELIADAHCGPF